VSLAHHPVKVDAQRLAERFLEEPWENVQPLFP
jgi:hypothetical protein